MNDYEQLLQQTDLMPADDDDDDDYDDDDDESTDVSLYVGRLLFIQVDRATIEATCTIPRLKYIHVYTLLRTVFKARRNCSCCGDVGVRGACIFASVARGRKRRKSCL